MKRTARIFWIAKEVPNGQLGYTAWDVLHRSHDPNDFWQVIEYSAYERLDRAFAKSINWFRERCGAHGEDGTTCSYCEFANKLEKELRE